MIWGSGYPDDWVFDYRPRKVNYTWDMLDSACKSLQHAFTVEDLKQHRNVTYEKKERKRIKKRKVTSGARRKRKPIPSFDHLEDAMEFSRQFALRCKKKWDKEKVREAEDDLIRTWRSYSLKRFNRDVKILHDCLPRARQIVQVYYDYLSQPGFIEHDSTVKSVIEKIPLAEFPLVDDWKMEIYIEQRIRLEKSRAETLWTAGFLESLPNRSCIQDKLSAHANLKLMRKEKDYGELMSHLKDPLDLEIHLSDYLRFLKLYRHLGIEEAKAKFRSHTQYELQEEEEVYKKEREAIPLPFDGPLNFLAKQEHQKQELQKQELQGYESTDYLLELLKLRTYFG